MKTYSVYEMGVELMDEFLSSKMGKMSNQELDAALIKAEEQGQIKLCFDDTLRGFREYLSETRWYNSGKRLPSGGAIVKKHRRGLYTASLTGGYNFVLIAQEDE